MRDFPKIASLALIVLLAACASPRVELGVVGGAGFKGPDSYRLMPGDGRALPGEDDIRAGVQQRLDVAGFRLAPAGSAPTYLVDVTYTDRPGPVGTYAHAVPAKKGEQPDWLTKPRRKPWWIMGKPGFCTLAVQVFDPGGVKEVYRVAASQRRLKTGCNRTALADAALKDIPVRPKTR